ncbi:hypothetical protein SODALDRAFT_271672 [Sodiomyces alkalinus F11]|uniref:SRR1-like domain-containing protein n=1 Tax=Sodiomyces alkalinus (strain CBS 110278 / VKM F-3762 / F11) TaxID=1314773 RepID=A0A3N2Q4I5_SODAK|nr:hypothetical protein SODALDRAFT_271672 [Sodiomyces alkalinus F11]ROT41626.1 hypothetical protein SODALDRAFT_271672 [Sodiomyces alkalinus F11]
MPATQPTQTDQSDKEGWTKVASKSRFRRAPRAVPTQKDLVAAKALYGRCRDQQPREPRPVYDIKNEFDSFSTRWRESESHQPQSLQSLILEHHKHHAPVRKAVCLGIGTFDPDDGSWEVKRRAHVQLAAFMAMVELLADISGETISCIFQEPLFSSTDKDFLLSLGHEVVDSPAAFDAVDEETLLFAIHMYRPIYEAALERALPVMFVGTGWETWDHVGNLKEGDFKCMQEMHASHRLFPFPRDGTSTTFSSTCLYWRPISTRQETTNPHVHRLDESAPAADASAGG